MVEARTERPLQILFAFMGLHGRLRFFDAVIEGLVERGHQVHVVLESDGWGDGVERAWRDRMAQKAGFSEEVVLRQKPSFMPTASCPTHSGHGQSPAGGPSYVTPNALGQTSSRW